MSDELSRGPVERGPVERIVSLRHEYGRLIQLAAQIAQRQGMPDVDSWRWPARVPRALSRDMRECLAEWFDGAKVTPNAGVQP